MGYIYQDIIGAESLKLIHAQKASKEGLEDQLRMERIKCKK